MKAFHRLRNKIILSVLLYLILIGIAGYVFLYTYLFRAVSAKAERLDRMNLGAVKTRLDSNFDALFSLAVLCANDPAVTALVSRQDREPREKLLDALGVQEKLNAYLRGSPVNPWVDKLILSDGGAVFIQAQGRQYGNPADQDRLRTLYAEYMAGDKDWVTGFGTSINRPVSWDMYIIFVPVRSSNNQAGGFIYLEAGLDMVTAVFRDYTLLPGLRAFTAPVDGSPGSPVSPAGRLLTEGAGYPAPPADGLRFRREGRSFRLDLAALEKAGLILYNEVDVTELRRDDREVFYTILLLIAGSLAAAGGLGLILSLALTRPIRRLITRIKKIGGGDLSCDPEIEKSSDEIGEIGRAVNEMSGSISRLMTEMEESFKQRRNTEIALLQTQINPHFLYNTLDSIRWMAKVQKNTGIADLTRSLINLLRNIAAGSGRLITVEEELALLEDYAAIMAIRFMGIFRLENRIDPALYRCLIPKLTLQPLVENAILHGIEPSKTFGSIVLEGRREGAFLVITVEDSGLGMNREQLAAILSREGTGKSGTSLNPVGVRNVDERLRLIYGEGSGLSFESGEGKFTRVTVRLGIREGEDAPGTAG